MQRAQKSMHGEVHNMCTCTHTQTKPHRPWHIICIYISPFHPEHTLTHTHTHTHTHTFWYWHMYVCTHTHTHTSSGGNYAFKRIFKSKNLQLTEGRIYINIYKDRSWQLNCIWLDTFLFTHNSVVNLLSLLHSTATMYAQTETNRKTHPHTDRSISERTCTVNDAASDSIIPLTVTISTGTGATHCSGVTCKHHYKNENLNTGMEVTQRNYASTI